MATQALRPEEYKSPLRKLVAFFRHSRDQWKEKYMIVKADIKRARNLARAAQRSRDQWKLKARDWEARARDWEQRHAQLQTELTRQAPASDDQKLHRVD